MLQRSSTTHIGQKAAQTNYHSAEQALRIGYPLTHLVTINYALTNIKPAQATAAFSKLRCSYFNKWIQRPRRGAGRPAEPTYVFSFENKQGDIVYKTMEEGDPHNVHVHWAVHVPANRLADFERRIWDWVGKTTGGIHGGVSAIDVRPFKGTSYIIKGANQGVLDIYGRGRKYSAQGIIVGRRADASRNLRPKARRAKDIELGKRRNPPSRRVQYGLSR